MKVLCIDIGASSGRFIVVDYEKSHFSIDEIYRFYNGMDKDSSNHLIWDFNRLFDEIKKGLKISLSKYDDILSLGIDTWGVDYGRMVNDKLIFNPYAYRDERCLKSMNDLLKDIDYKNIYFKSGIQKLPFNTIFQLYSDKENNNKLDEILLIPDLIIYYLTGKKYCELTNLSTTSLYNPINRCIDQDLLSYSGFNKNIFPSLINPGEEIGYLKEDIVKELGIYNIKVIASTSHDTASAIASIPLSKNSLYLSSGTWSLLGTELINPIINEKSYEYNFTNEIGYNHSVRFLKNIMGLFIIQEYRKSLINKGINIEFKDMLSESKKIKNNEIYIDIDDKLFETPFDMENKIITYLKKTNQKYDLSIGEICRSIYESMAFKYLEEFNKLKEVTKLEYTELFIVGGGANIDLLNKLTANILNIDVIEGEKEATVYGNALVQFIYHQEFKDLFDARSKLKDDHQYKVYHPENHEFYINKYQKYKEIIRRIK